MDLLSSLTDDWQSGEELAAQLGVSRAAVSKAAGVLAESGVPVEVERSSGYRFQPGTPAPPALASALTARGLGDAPDVVGRSYRYLGKATSTQDELRTWIGEGAPRGAVVLAERQTQGRGRRGRTWTSADEPGRGLTFSVLLTPGSVSQLPLLPLVAGLALARVCGAGSHVKWPNDLLAPDGRKIAGILVEAQTIGSEVAFAMVGIGINVTPPAPEGGATFADLGAEPRTRVDVLADVLSELGAQTDRLDRGDVDGILADWTAHSRMFSEPVRIEVGEGVVEGIASGLDATGGLLVKTKDGGEPVLVSAGDVEMISR